MSIFTIEYVIGLAIIGIVAGFLSGLLGVGGGFLIVPFQLFLMEYFNVDPKVAMLVAIGTSLAIIVPTSLTGAYKHSKYSKDMIKPGIKLGVFGIIGSLIGGQFAAMLPTNILKYVFGIFLLIIAIYNVATMNECKSKARIKFSWINAAIIGILIGLCSGLLGVGGGLFLIVILTALLGFKMVDSVGISLVYTSLTAIGGVGSYILSGWSVNTLPYCVGYVSVFNLIFIAVCSVPLAYFGAKVSHRLPGKRLKQIFSIILVYVGLKMLGILP